jgi:hypothetical protein
MGPKSSRGKVEKKPIKYRNDIHIFITHVCVDATIFFKKP